MRAFRPSQSPVLWEWGNHVDMRRTLKKWARSGGIGFRYQRAKRRVKPGRLVVLWDVSSSMAGFIPLYLPWLYRLAASSKEVGVFPFGVRITDATDGLKQSYREAIKSVAAIPDLWESGTSVGTVMQTWVKHYGERWIHGRTTVLIISDGWDSGAPDAVTEALRIMRARGARIAWLIPWLASPGFELKTRSLLAAKPYVDLWLAGGSREELQQIRM